MLVGSPLMASASKTGMLKHMQMSKMLLPNTLETAASYCPFLALITERAVSGTDVPAAITTNPMITPSIPNMSPSAREDSTRR